MAANSDGTPPTAESPSRTGPPTISSPAESQASDGRASEQTTRRSPAFTETTCGISSSLSATPLSARLADMADRCGELLGELFDEEERRREGDEGSPRPPGFSPLPEATPGDVSTPRAITIGDSSPSGGSRSTPTPAFRPDHPATKPVWPRSPLHTFPRYEELPEEIRDRILSEVLGARTPRWLDRRMRRWKAPPPLVTRVSKETRRRALHPTELAWSSTTAPLAPRTPETPTAVVTQARRCTPAEEKQVRMENRDAGPGVDDGG